MPTIQFKCNLQLTIIIISMERDEPQKRSDQKVKRNESESEEE
jgi:hypothetical protein